MDKKWEKLKIKGLERTTSNLFNQTIQGRVFTILIRILGIISIFIYYYFGINIFFSIILGFLTYSILGALFDIAIGKLFRLYKQFNWLTKTPKGIEFLKSKGLTKEQIEEFKKESGVSFLIK